MNRRLSHIVDEQGNRIRRYVSAQGCVIECFFSHGDAGTEIENVVLSTVLTLQPEVRETVLNR